MSQTIPLAKMNDLSGPAFPACNEANLNDTMGMTLRDWFAGQALNGILCATARELLPTEAMSMIQDKAHSAYVIADAMLAERAKATTP